MLFSVNRGHMRTFSLSLSHSLLSLSPLCLSLSIPLSSVCLCLSLSPLSVSPSLLSVCLSPLCLSVSSLSVYPLQSIVLLIYTKDIKRHREAPSSEPFLQMHSLLFKRMREWKVIPIFSCKNPFLFIGSKYMWTIGPWVTSRSLYNCEVIGWRGEIYGIRKYT